MITNSKENIVVVGGGTAGWLTALFAKKKYPDKEVTLIESEEIGILGAGEGTTPYVHDILQYIDVPFVGLISKCKSSIKVGLKYANWSKKNPVYYHTFENLFPILKTYKQCDVHEFFTECYRAGKLPVMNTLTAKVCEQNRVPLIKNGEDLNSLQPVAATAVHFDARLLAGYLKEVGLSRGIVRKEGIVESVESDDQGYIKSIKLKDGSTVDVTFIFDCTGFRRFFIGEHFKSQWRDLSSMLPAKRALAFFLDRKNAIPSYTGVIAQKYGWMWQIPLQHRFGCGYVFDTDFINDDEAKKEIEQTAGHSVDIVNSFKFNPGYFDQIWIKNCISIGLAGGFLEPLEATAIHQLGRNLIDFFSYENFIYEKDQKTIDEYNKKYALETQQIADFLHLHYITDRDDTEFWSKFTTNNTTPDSIKSLLEFNEYRLLKPQDFTGQLIFGVDNYLSIMSGNNIISKTALDNSMYHTIDKQSALREYLDNNDILMDDLMFHDDFIDFIKQIDADKEV